MNAPQAYVTYGNIPPELVVSSSVTLTGSVTPSTIQIVCAPLPLAPSQRGTFTIHYGPRKIVFPECRLAEVVNDTTTEGKRVSVVTLLDRRWKWRFGRIRGTYNWWVGNNEVWPQNKKTPLELIRLLFAAMGEDEKKLKLVNIPNKTYPFCDWDGVPSEALAALLDTLGCRLSYDPITDSVIVAPVGQGAKLPATLDVITDNAKIDPPEVPDEIRFLGGKTQVEWDVPLEAVGEQEDVAIVPIDALAFKPVGGWHVEDPEAFFGVAEKQRKLAVKTVFRYYRPKLPIVLKSPVNEEIKIERLEQLLPLNTVRVEVTPKTPFRAEEPKAAVVWGDWYDKNPTDMNPDPIKRPEQIPTQIGWRAIYHNGFSIDAERGLVIFSDPVYRFADANGQAPKNFADPFATQVWPATLFIRLALSFRDPKSLAWVRREEKFADPPQGKAKKIPRLVQWVDRDDIAAKAWVNFAAFPFKWKTNKVEFRQQAEYYVRQAMAKYFIQDPGSRNYAGILPISPDSAITQVSWVISEDGQATTTAARNVETDVNVPTYDQKRKEEKINALLKRAAEFEGRKDAPAVANFLPGKKP